jgi:hypothetical protein
MRVIDFGKKCIDLKCLWNCFLTDFATNTAGVAVFTYDGALVMAVTQHMNGGSSGGQTDDMAWTDGDTTAATGTALSVNLSQATSGHANGIERAGMNTGFQPQAASRTLFGATGNFICCIAVVQTEITVFQRGVRDVPTAADNGNLWFCGLSFNVHDFGQLLDKLTAAGKA